MKVKIFITEDEFDEYASVAKNRDDFAKIVCKKAKIPVKNVDQIRVDSIHYGSAVWYKEITEEVTDEHKESV